MYVYFLFKLSFLWSLFIYLIKNAYRTENKLFFFKIHNFFRKNPIIQILII